MGGRLSTGHVPRSYARTVESCTEYAAAAAALDARTAAWYSRTGTAVPVGAPTAVDILASFLTVRGLVFGSTAGHGAVVLLNQAASNP